MIEYLLFEQKYMEAVAGGRTIEAIEVLQTELYQRAPMQDRLHELAQLILLAQMETTAVVPQNVQKNPIVEKTALKNGNCINQLTNDEVIKVEQEDDRNKDTD